MILNCSGRSDIPAFYSEWFSNRMKAGYVDVRNPFYPRQISRIPLGKDHIEAIVFCTKNPIPMIPYLAEWQDYPLLFQVTLTPYGKEIEPHLPPKGQIVKAIHDLSMRLGKEAVVLRYDPIFISKRYSLSFHKAMFEKVCRHLEGSITTVIISFLDFKKNTVIHQDHLQVIPFQKQDIEQLAQAFAAIAQKYQLTIQTCAEDYDLSQYGIKKRGCISEEAIALLSQRERRHRRCKNRKNCLCIETVDIGTYNSCPHFCKYCYANYDESQVMTNYQKHDPHSSLLIGEITEQDIIKIRQEKVPSIVHH